jgi:hypothetical protein
MTPALQKISLLSLLLLHSAMSIAQVIFKKSYEQVQKEATVKQQPIFVSVDFSTDKKC